MLHRILGSLALLALIGSVFEVRADEAGDVEMALRQFYGQLSAGEYEAALDHVKLGANGYVATGLLATIASDDIRERVVSGMQADHEKGAEMTLRPEYIHVAVHGNVAIATYLIDAKFKDAEDDEEEGQVNRGTLVWQQTEDGWKIVHWHVSKLTADDDD